MARKNEAQHKCKKKEKQTAEEIETQIVGGLSNLNGALRVVCLLASWLAVCVQVIKVDMIFSGTVFS